MTPSLRAALLLSVVVLTFVLSVATGPGSRSSPHLPTSLTDPQVYDRMLSRLRAGESYYTVVGSELRANKYATVEVFNWRTPLLWRSLAPLPPGLRRGLLTALAVLGAVFATVLAQRRSAIAAAVTGVASLGVAIMMSAPGSVGMGEAWAGVLVGLSVCAYAQGGNLTAVACGLLAIFVRELVAPYTLICTALAVRRRRWGEVATWLIGGVAYAVYYGIHMMQVSAHRLPTDMPGAGSWVAWGGLPFLLSTVEWNSWLFFAPWAFVGFALSIIVAGVLAEHAPVHLRLTAGVYGLMFLVVGQPFDRYWGFLVWPTWMLACGFGADAIVEAVRTLLRAPSGTDLPARIG
jgi:hypothetical protein